MRGADNAAADDINRQGGHHNAAIYTRTFNPFTRSNVGAVTLLVLTVCSIVQAMEQQTISIAKAGITTMLKARTSVLAAANPPSGRYDDLANLEDNIELQTTILSRFDLIFIVKDTRTRERDAMIANHVLNIHRQGGSKQGARPVSGLASMYRIDVLWL